MKYCADTWYVLNLFSKEENSIRIFNDIRLGKDFLILPVIVISESYKKLLQHGISEKLIDSFFESIDVSDKIEIVFIDNVIAKECAKVSLSYSIPLIDSIIAATARLTDCNFLLSDDKHLKLLHRKRYVKVKSW